MARRGRRWWRGDSEVEKTAAVPPRTAEPAAVVDVAVVASLSAGRTAAGSSGGELLEGCGRDETCAGDAAWVLPANVERKRRTRKATQQMQATGIRSRCTTTSIERCAVTEQTEAENSSRQKQREGTSE